MFLGWRRELLNVSADRSDGRKLLEYDVSDLWRSSVSAAFENSSLGHGDSAATAARPKTQVLIIASDEIRRALELSFETGPS